MAMAQDPPFDKGRTRLVGRATTLLLIAPSIVLVVVLIALPMLQLGSYSFANSGAYGGVEPGFTLDNYREVFSPLYRPIFVETLKLSVLSTLLCLAIGYPVAYFIAFRARAWAGLLLAMLLIPFWVDFVVRMSAFMVIMGRYGPINSALEALSLIDTPLRMLGTYPAVLVGMLYAFLPVTVLPIYAALNGIDERLHEAAADLGANQPRTFLRVTLPLSMPGVMTSILFVFVPSMGVFAIPVLLGGGKSIILGNLIVQLFLEFRNMPMGAAVAVILLAISVVLIVAYMAMLTRVERALR